MGLAKRRRVLGYSQEKLAELLGVDRTTVGRWEAGRIAPQPPQRRRLAAALDVSLQELDALLSTSRTADGAETTHEAEVRPNAGEHDEMIRRVSSLARPQRSTCRSSRRRNRSPRYGCSTGDAH
ncbi:helix-turn-helix transcriptional regulator [Streptomyces sp. ICBB 8177]|uniref:helix-turn-helix transcriptional regulator n=1 Tax=Streptomyces sp. ICBB 8177 TaxID=563922 RepID=UPI00316ADA26